MQFPTQEVSWVNGLIVYNGVLLSQSWHDIEWDDWIGQISDFNPQLKTRSSPFQGELGGLIAGFIVLTTLYTSTSSV